MKNAKFERRGFLGMLGGLLGALLTGCGAKSPQSVPPLPTYWDSELPAVFRGPYMQRDARIAVFLLASEIKVLRRLCDRTFNVPTDGAVHYMPFGPYVLLVYADMQVQSLDERDHELGWMRETEVGFWVPLIAHTNAAGVEVPQHMAWMLPYLFVDNPYALAAGREVYGFSKTWAAFDKVATIQDPEFSVETWAFAELGPEVEGKQQTLLDVQRVDEELEGAASVPWTNWDAARSALIRQLFWEWAPATDDWWFKTLETMPLVFLKQFRDAAHMAKACYQSVLEAPIGIETFHGGGFISQNYTVTFQPLVSHPLPQVLGLPVGRTGALRALAAFWLHLDFTLGQGIKVWEYPS